MSVNRVLFCCVAIFLSTVPGFSADKLKPEEIVARHLDSIGSAAVRESAKTRLISGTVQMQFISGGSGTAVGNVQISSQEPKVSTVMKFSNPNYEGEEFTFDGENVKIGYMRSGTRSRLGAFLDNQPQIVREGLLGGVLSTDWPLLSLASKQAKLSNDGLKKIDGRQLYQLEYRPKKSCDLVIKLYFDPVTFHHVMTVYSLTLVPRIGPNDITNAQQQSMRIRLEEKFDDFKSGGGLTLPTSWVIRLTSETQSTVVAEWEMALQKFSLKSQADEGK